jgi:hypothetical protein
MNEMSDFYIHVLLRATGKNLKAEVVNRVISEYNEKLRNLRVEEERKDGKIFKFWVQDVDDYKHELLSEDMLICSRKIKFEVRDPLPHSFNNYSHFVRARIHKALKELRVESFQSNKESIVVETIETYAEGCDRTGRWPRDPFDQAFL